MKFSLRINLFGSLVVTAFVMLAGVMVVAHPTGFFDLLPGCGASGSASGSASAPGGKPSAKPSPSASDEPCPSGSASDEPSGNPSDSGSPSPTTGAIAGHLTSATGAALRSTPVTAHPVLGGPDHRATTDTSGKYRISKLPPGNYRVSFQLPGTSLVEYARHKKVETQASLIAVTAGHTTTVDEQALPVGTVTGHLRDRKGHPVVAARVAVLSTDDIRLSQFTMTDSAGAFTTHVFTGIFTVRFTFGTLTQYAVQQIDDTLAKKYHVGSSSPTVVEETTVPTGKIGGKITERDGSPAAGARVVLTPVTNNDLTLSATVASDGRYGFDPVPVGTYRLQLTAADQSRRQWVSHTVDDRQAASIAVTVDQTTTVNDQFLATGALRVTATDPAGQPLTNYCATVTGGGNQRGGCTLSGPVEIAGIPAGTSYQLAVSVPDNSRLRTVLRGVTVVAGKTTSRTVVLQPSATIQTTTIDARTHQPVPFICVDAVSPGGQRLPAQRGCSDANGKVRIGGLAAGSYVLLAHALDGVHGSQWVGPTGGTGNESLAQTVTVQPGQVRTQPAITLDPSGGVKGTVTDKVSGKAVADVCVTVIPIGLGDSFGVGCEGARTDSAGHYTLSGLGPYAWPVEYALTTPTPGYAWQWSGGAAGRKQATPVVVTAGATVTANAALSAGTTVGGAVVDGHGAPLTTRVAVVNTDTGDLAATPVFVFGRYQVRVVPQTVRIAYSGPFADPPVFWYHNATDFTHATPVPVSTSPVTADLGTP
jgi:hypothetical protein